MIKTYSRWLGLLLTVLLIGCLYPNLAEAGEFQCDGHQDTCQCGRDNPYPCCDNTGDGDYNDNNDGNCTWWAWHMMCCNWSWSDTNKAPGSWGNAKSWLSNAQADGYPTGTEPRVGSVFVSTSGTYGHVGWVFKIVGSTIYTTEMQCGYWNQYTNEDGQANTDQGYKTRSASWAHGYIYEKDTAYDLRLYSSVVVNPNPIIQNTPVTVTVSIANYGNDSFSGNIAAAIHNTSGVFLEDIEVKYGESITGGYYKNYTFNKSNPFTSPGTYKLHIKYQPDGGNWDNIPEGNYTNPVNVTITSSDSSSSTTTIGYSSTTTVGYSSSSSSTTTVGYSSSSTTTIGYSSSSSSTTTIGYSSSSSSTTTIGYSSSSTTTVQPVSSTTTYQSSSTTTTGYSSSSTTTIGYSSSSTTTIAPVSSSTTYQSSSTTTTAPVSSTTTTLSSSTTTVGNSSTTTIGNSSTTTVGNSSTTTTGYSSSSTTAASSSTTTSLYNSSSTTTQPVASTTTYQSSSTTSIPNGYMVTSNLWIKAVINTVEKGPIDAVWQKGGEDTTARGDRVIWGHFYASPSDVTWGSENNPDLFVKIWFDVSGRIDVNYFHVSVPDIEVYSDYPYDGMVDEQGTTTMDRRYIRQYYQNGQSYSEENYEDGYPPAGYWPTGDPFGYLTINDLRIGSIINTVEKGPIDALWRLGGQDTTARGDQVVWGLFYASPNDVTWGNEDNPDLFVKIWFDVSGRVDVNFFHVSVPDIEVYSDLPDDGSYDQKGTTIMDNRYIRHEYWR